jgi:hypothetical protein
VEDRASEVEGEAVVEVEAGGDVEAEVGSDVEVETGGDDAADVPAGVCGAAIDLVRVADGNRLQWDVRNTGTMAVDVAPFATLTVATPLPPFSETRDGIVGAFVNSLDEPAVSFDGYGWASLALGGTASVYSEPVGAIVTAAVSNARLHDGAAYCGSAYPAGGELRVDLNPRGAYPGGGYGTWAGSTIADGFHFDPASGIAVNAYFTGDGGQMHLRDYYRYAGLKGLVVYATAGWCAICGTISSELEAVYQAYRAQGVMFLGVVFQTEDFGYTDPAYAGDYAARHGWTFSAGSDPTGGAQLNPYAPVSGNQTALTIIVDVDAMTIGDVFQGSSDLGVTVGRIRGSIEALL